MGAGRRHRRRHPQHDPGPGRQRCADRQHRRAQRQRPVAQPIPAVQRRQSGGDPQQRQRPYPEHPTGRHHRRQPQLQGAGRQHHSQRSDRRQRQPAEWLHRSRRSGRARHRRQPLRRHLQRLRLHQHPARDPDHRQAGAEQWRAGPLQRAERQRHGRRRRAERRQRRPVRDHHPQRENQRRAACQKPHPRHRAQRRQRPDAQPHRAGRRRQRHATTGHRQFSAGRHVRRCDQTGGHREGRGRASGRQSGGQRRGHSDRRQRPPEHGPGLGQWRRQGASGKPGGPRGDLWAERRGANVRRAGGAAERGGAGSHQPERWRAVDQQRYRRSRGQCRQQPQCQRRCGAQGAESA